MDINNIENRPPPEVHIENSKPVKEVVEEVKETPKPVKENNNIDVFA